MGFGSTAKKVQRVATLAEETYERIAELRERLLETREAVDETSDRVGAMEVELAEQRAILEAVAAAQGVDVEDALAEVEEADASAAEEASSPDAETTAE